MKRESSEGASFSGSHPESSPAGRPPQRHVGRTEDVASAVETNGSQATTSKTQRARPHPPATEDTPHLHPLHLISLSSGRVIHGQPSRGPYLSSEFASGLWGGEALASTFARIDAVRRWRARKRSRATRPGSARMAARPSAAGALSLPSPCASGWSNAQGRRGG